MVVMWSQCGKMKKKQKKKSFKKRNPIAISLQYTIFHIVESKKRYKRNARTNEDFQGTEEEV